MLIFISLFFGIGGIFLICLGYSWLKKTRKLMEAGVSTIGEVVDQEKSRGEYGIYYHPIVKFRDNDKKERIVKASYGTGHPWQIGEIIKIRYHPDESDNIFIDDFHDTWGWPILLLLIGPVFLIFGILIGLFGE